MIEHQVETKLESSQLEKKVPPPMWRVILLNDDFTPMDYVTHILQLFFALSLEKARQVMLTVHHEGRGVAGIYSKDIAVTKVIQVMEHARTHQYPLQCIAEIDS